jgi:hypothetical protein
MHVMIALVNTYVASQQLCTPLERLLSSDTASPKSLLSMDCFKRFKAFVLLIHSSPSPDSKIKCLCTLASKRASARRASAIQSSRSHTTTQHPSSNQDIVTAPCNNTSQSTGNYFSFSADSSAAFFFLNPSRRAFICSTRSFSYTRVACTRFKTVTLDGSQKGIFLICWPPAKDSQTLKQL